MPRYLKYLVPKNAFYLRSKFEKYQPLLIFKTVKDDPTGSDGSLTVECLLKILLALNVG